MMGWAAELFPICRSITGPGVRETLSYIQKLLLGLKVHSVPSGSKHLGWTVPDEWTIRNAWIGGTDINLAKNNLHVVGYSEPINRIVSRKELLAHIHSAVGRIPYVTSYYKRTWGFCCTEEQERALTNEEYFVVIDSELKPGNLNYGEIIIPGAETSEILLSTYICHPSMANDNLSGIVVLIAMAQWLQSEPRRHTYRIVFNPETIGSIVYISENDLSKVIAGYVISRVGTKGHLRFTNTRQANTLADRVARMVSDHCPHSFLYRASDERQFNYPQTDLPICALSRGEYPEYHSSLDTLEIISEARLGEALEVCQRAIEIVESNRVYFGTTRCEPQLGSLYPPRPDGPIPAPLMNLLAYSDGRDLIELSQTTGIDFKQCVTMAEQLRAAGFLTSNMSPTAQSRNMKRAAGE